MNLFKPGDKVIVNPAQQCNACLSCSKGQMNLCEHPTVLGVSVDGGFSEYVKSSYTHLYKMPENLSFEEGAMIEPLACATYGVENLNLKLGDFVVVIGPGTLGLMMTQLIKAKGAGKVALVGIFDYGLEKGKELGADYVINTVKKNSLYYVDDLKGRISELTNGELAQRVIVPTNAKQAMQQALEISGKKSTVVYFGLPGPKDILEVPALSTLTQDKTIRFSWLAPLTWPLAIKAAETGKVNLKKLITNRFSLKEAGEGIIFMNSQVEEKIRGMVII